MEFDEWYEKAKDTVFEETEPAIQYRMAKLAWNAAIDTVIKSRNPEKPEEHFACHFNNYPEDCLLDKGDHDDCIESASWKDKNRTKFECKYWRFIDE